MTPKVVEMAYDSGDLCIAEDGFLVFWPLAFHGSFTAQNLRDLADEMDRRNSAWSAQIDEYFSEEKS